jgi:hypothetical protein
MISLRGKAFVDQVVQGRVDTSFYVFAILASAPFRQWYYPNPVDDPFLLDQTAVFVRTGSTELEQLAHWQHVTVGR